MPLPVLEAAKYTTKVPSTGKIIEYRPFLVKEEKILMVAQESNDSSQIIRALKDIIHICTFKAVKPNELTIYDLEYLFLQLRAKSVGETSELRFKCAECKVSNDVEIDLSTIEVKFPKDKVDNKIQLTDTVGVVLRPLSIGKTEELSKVKDSDVLTRSVAAYIESIYDDDNVYMSDDTPAKEMTDFIDSLSHKNLEDIQQYMTQQPQLKEDVEFMCTSCTHANKITITGLQSFF